ncbi:MAG: hypothetical protein C0454_12840, partial [Parvibaculum sp.]|nr:hypothetical protein [Parvibaculum sp.]
RLSEHITTLDQKFVVPYLPAEPSSGPDEWGHATKAFCVLAHAAFEDYVESLSLAVMHEAIGRWETKKELTRPLLTLVSFYQIRIRCEEDPEQDQLRVFDLLRMGIDEAKQAHSSAIHNNHGFDTPYLRKVLTPVGIDSDAELRFAGSITKLCAARGTFAHTLEPGATYSIGKSMSSTAPEDARKIVGDCMDFCAKLSERAERCFPEK